MQRDDVVTLDVSTTPLAVRLTKVESACFAGQIPAAPQRCLYLPPTQPWVTLTGDMAPNQQPSLPSGHIFLFNRSCQAEQLASLGRVPQGHRFGAYLFRAGEELGYNCPVCSTAVGRYTAILRVRGRDVIALAGYPVGIAEIRKPRFRPVLLKLCSEARKPGAQPVPTGHASRTDPRLRYRRKSRLDFRAPE